MIHRFTSPEWFSTLKKHVSIFDEDKDATQLFKAITSLRTGEALLFAPSALIAFADGEAPKKLHSEFLKVKVRKRLTWDVSAGGKISHAYANQSFLLREENLSCVYSSPF